ncbi:MAG: D-alanyl-D-alanine carboxypeptidase [Hespellia sp.]|nr:D-alanyl-D-alanine carboxypeptidase [Hespellia sp.]
MKKFFIRIRFLFCIILIAVLCIQATCPKRVLAESNSTQQDTPEELKQLYAQSAVLMDAESGRILFEKNGGEVRPMASTTKIMTCILALEYGDLDSEVTVSDHAASQPKVHLGMTSGQTFYLRDLLYSLMLESHNDTAVAIAEHISGSVESFAQLMNRKAESIGMRHTHFVTPNGLDASDEGGAHTTTAAELAAIMKYCIQDSPQKDMFLEITQAGNHTFTDLSGTRSYSCNNHNAFLGMMEGVLSGKTGFTGKAGYCYVGALQQDDRCFIVALLGCGWPNNKGYKWSDTKKLMNYGLEHYHYRDVWEEVSPRVISVQDGATWETGLFEESSVVAKPKTERKSLSVLLAEDEEVSVKVAVEEQLQAPIKKGMKVGSIRYELDGKPLVVIPIVTDRTVIRRDFPWVLRQVFHKALLHNI